MPTKPLVTSYRQDQQLFPDLWHKIGLSLAAIFCLAYPFLAEGQWLTVANLALIAVVGAVGMMILTGFAGQISLGHAAFLAVGAYTVGTLGFHWQVPFWLALPAAGLISAAVGLAVGPFALRLRGLYLAIVTLGLLFLVEHVLLAFPDLTGGVTGISVPMHSWFVSAEEASTFGSFTEPLTIAGYEFGFDQKLYFLFLAIALVAAFTSKNIARSNSGRAMIAVRDHDLAAAVLGVNPGKTKTIAFGISSFFAGIAGAMYAFQQQYITAEPFNLAMSVEYIAIIVLGGIGTTFGAVAGAIAFVVLAPLAEIFGEYIPYFNSLSGGQQETLLFATIVIGFLVFEPLGLYGIWLRIKRYFMAWPFRY
jgi:branched-chain amino acid transport system permease protein